MWDSWPEYVALVLDPLLSLAFHTAASLPFYTRLLFPVFAVVFPLSRGSLAQVPLAQVPLAQISLAQVLLAPLHSI